MKSNKGITLTSLVIYIICLVIVIGLMSSFTGYFFKNTNEVTINQNADEQYTKFLSYITKDVNTDDLIYAKTGVNSTDCIIFKFETGIEHQYVFANGNIYYISIENQNEKKITMCENVVKSANNTPIFSYENSKIDINFNIKEKNFSATLSVNI